jgi:hypothetical protein
MFDDSYQENLSNGFSIPGPYKYLLSKGVPWTKLRSQGYTLELGLRLQGTELVKCKTF